MTSPATGVGPSSPIAAIDRASYLLGSIGGAGGGGGGGCLPALIAAFAATTAAPVLTISVAAVMMSNALCFSIGPRSTCSTMIIRPS